MREIIANVTEYATAEDDCGNIPVPVEYKMRKSVERDREYNEQRWWHD